MASAGSGGSARADDAVRVRLVSDKSEYVAGEPIKFVVTIRNTSGAPVRVPHLFLLDPLYMYFMYYEIEGPDRRIDNLKHVRIQEKAVWGRNYSGAPLAPGDSLHIFLYPNKCNRTVNADGTGERSISLRMPFSSPGTFKVRVAYASRPDLVGLPAGVWYSNPVMLRVRAPDAIEEQILTTLWHCMADGESGLDWVIRELNQLEALVSEYPEHPLMNHVRFALARAYVAEDARGQGDRAADAVRILTDMIATSRFRFEECHYFLGEAYIREGEPERAASVFFEAMEIEPALWANPRFVEAITVIGVRPYSVWSQWYERESQLGAKPMSRAQFMREFTQE